MRFSLFAVAAVLCVSSLAAHADTVYTYTGAHYAVVTAPFTTSQSVEGTFTFGTALAANLNRATVTPSSYSFSDGASSFNSADMLDAALFLVSTDASGVVSGYQFSFGNITLSESAFVTAFSIFGTNVSTFNGYAFGSLPGTLTSQVSSPAVTPEPSSIALLGTGIVGIAGIIRKRLAV